MSRHLKKAGREVIQLSSNNFLNEEKAGREAYNRNLMDIHENIKSGTLPGNRILIRLFKFEFDTTTEGGLIIPKFKKYETDGGRLASKIEEIKWQPRGVVVKLGDDMTEGDRNRYKVGDIVWIPLSSMMSGTEFFEERDTPAASFNGYILLNPGTIQFIESTRYEDLEFEEILPTSPELDPFWAEAEVVHEEDNESNEENTVNILENEITEHE